MSLTRQIKRKTGDSRHQADIEQAYNQGAKAQMEKLTLAMVKVLDRLEEIDDIGKIRAAKVKLFFWNEIGR